ncbi:MAG: nicotinamide riboside transporter PnuC, partial [Alphaproteobacteria bacterium]
MTPIEIIATLFGLASVWLTVRRNIWLWPTGLVMVALYAFIFYEARLYSQAVLQVIFVVLQVYGWHHWLRGGGGNEALPVSRLTWRQTLAWLGAAVAGAAVLGHAMDRWFDAAMAYPDAFITTLSLVSQWLLGRKVLESWLGWIVVDVVAIGVYLAQDLRL